MGDREIIKASEVLKTTRIDAERLLRIVDEAEGAFWESVTRSVPEARTGDLGPDVAAHFTVECREAVKAWLMANVRPVPTSGKVTVSVELRAPRGGERGWWVTDDSSPEAALREVIRESDDIEELGFAVLHDDTYEGQTYDEEGMRIVTVIVEGPPMSPTEAWDKIKDLP